MAKLDQRNSLASTVWSMPPLSKYPMDLGIGRMTAEDDDDEFLEME